MENVLDYQRMDFAEAARREAKAGRAFVVRLDGPALAELHDLVRDGSLPDVGKTALRPCLQPLLGVWMLAEGLGCALGFDVAGGTLRVGARRP